MNGESKMTDATQGKKKKNTPRGKKKKNVARDTAVKNTAVKSNLQDPPLEKADATPAKVAPALRHRILVVDDEPDLEVLMQQRMRRHIKSGEYTFVFAMDGVDALKVLNEDADIDMVVSDINMPRMDGLTLLEQIPGVNPNVRAIIVSAYGDMKNIRTAMNRGAFDFVTKPIDFEDLRITIDRTLQHLTMWRDALSSRDRLVVLQNELNTASKMQQSILPMEFPQGDDYHIHGHMEPAQDVGGDFYDVMQLGGGKVGLAIADVSGKGIPAALFMMSSRTSLKGAAIGHLEPGDVLEEVNNLLLENNDALMFLTVFYAIYEPATGILTYANAGHCPPLLVHADGKQEELPPSQGCLLGIMPDLKFKQCSIGLLPGDTLIMYTDGVTEANNDKSELFGMPRLQKACADIQGLSATEVTDVIFKAVKDYAGNAPQFDDITCINLVRQKI